MAGGLVFYAASAAHLVHAGPIGIDAFSGSATVIEFEEFVSAPPVGPFVEKGVTFSEASTGSGGPGWRIVNGLWVPGNNVLTDNASIADITLDFATPFERVGLDVGFLQSSPGFFTTFFDVRFFDPSLGLLGTIVIGPLPPALFGFAGWEDTGGISRVQIIKTSGDDFRLTAMDTVRFENAITPEPIPEPGTLVLFGLGLAGLGFARCKPAA